jgi:hypothetical protein
VNGVNSWTADLIGRGTDDMAMCRPRNQPRAISIGFKIFRSWYYKHHAVDDPSKSERPCNPLVAPITIHFFICVGAYNQDGNFLTLILRRNIEEEIEFEPGGSISLAFGQRYDVGTGQIFNGGSHLLNGAGIDRSAKVSLKEIRNVVRFPDPSK